jgi:tetratricopeptide (TPR) repeat protein
MNDRHTFLHYLTGAMAVTALVASPVLAQEQEDLPVLVDKGLKALNAQNWQEALKIHTEITDRFGKNNPLVAYGPQFGNLYYRKGISELRLNQWQDAINSLEIVYKNFPNSARPGGGNQFEKQALLRMAEAYMGMENWQEAINHFEKFLKERDKTKDKYTEGSFHINMAICHFKLADIPKGSEHLETAIKNKVRFKTAETGIVAAFQALVGAAIAKKNEGALVDFIRRNRGDLIVPPFVIQQYAPVYMKSAAEAFAADMQRAAIELYQFVPPSDTVVEDLRARLSSMGNLRGLKDGERTLIKEQLEQALKRYEELRRGNKSAEMIKLGAMAYFHESHGNIRGAYAVYQQLETFYPNAEKREDNLFNLVRTSSIISPGTVTQKHGELFLKTFPDSKHVPTVKRMLLSALFFDGEYDLCIEVAEPMLPDLNNNTEEHDICLHVLSGSYFFTGRYEEAQPLLDKHVEMYPESKFAVSAMYFQASNTSRLQSWNKAASLLQTFLEKNADPQKNVYYPFALYDLANCHYSEEKHEEAMKVLERIINEFPDCQVIDQTWNLRGSLEVTLGKREEAEKSYIKGLEIADRRKHQAIAGESLFSLVALLGDKANGEDRLKDAVPYADRYWKEVSAVAPYNARVAVAQLVAFRAVGRDEEALERLREVIVELSRDPQATGLEEMINSYKEAYLAKYSADQLKEHFYNFPGIRSADRAARALLRVAVVSVFEEMVRKAEDDATKSKAQAGITVLFRELKADFEVKDLTNFILVRLGDFLRTNTSNPREALPYYDEALSRKDQAYRFNALLGRADLYGMSTNPADIEKALEDFNRIYADSQEKPQREFALYRIVQLLMVKKDYANAEKQAKVYLDREKTGFSKFSATVSLLLAQSFDSRNMMEDAASVYATLGAGATIGNIKISAPAMKRWMEIIWDRNKPAADQFAKSDRQGAYEQGATYVKLTSRFKEKFTDEETASWNEVEKLVLNYESSPGIKSMKQIEREKQEATR